ncbi:hypothetical protein GGR02_000836 [Anoxybacillus voinovskiensis]|uniref:Uncharacterized protein n=1 Tax=Anoxybacteroides voinovskiense TaxID=230470 RepID=A0A840DN66_9BACL|nr:hypothetical protein [Anoxybacillus voinovskiensis]MBB4073075.1 hypothetical protein [Anoxybacillus voinovskiensis]GGJ59670.1 hypothetical protein GCM10008982_05920 [Anoxybacillus voinovskiensis]
MSETVIVGGYTVKSPAVICQGEKSSKLEIRLSDDPKKGNT